MKRAITLLLAVIMVLCICACSSKEEKATEEKATKGGIKAAVMTRGNLLCYGMIVGGNEMKKSSVNVTNIDYTSEDQFIKNKKL